MSTKQEQSEALEAERYEVVGLLDAELAKDFVTIEREELRVQMILESEATKNHLTTRLNQIDMALTMLCVGGLE